MVFPKRVERWRSMVQSEIDRLGVPFPADYQLGIIQRESNGKPGEVNPVSGASGLTQVMPITIKDYNQHHTHKYTMSQLRNPNEPRIQIRVGLWVLKTFFRSAHRYLKKRLETIPLDELVKVTDTFYAAGPKNAKSRLNKIKPTWANVKARFPNWDRIAPAELVWERSSRKGLWDLPAVEQWLRTAITDERQTAVGGAAIALLILVAAIAIMKGKK
jgi:hypothetical protein